MEHAQPWRHDGLAVANPAKRIFDGGDDIGHTNVESLGVCVREIKHR
jgi:hypothetical protein